MSRSLGQRLHALGESYRQTLALIQELSKFPSASDNVTDPDERRLELATEIHDSLKEQEDTLEILRFEISDDSYPSHRRSAQGDRGSEHERNADLVVRLTEDLKSARAAFRRAQLQAKRNLDALKRKEREQLFADRKADGLSSSRQQGRERLTQDELAVQAAEDVTRALRRVHNQLQGEVAQSQFAQQTLDESQQALKSLSDSYGGTTDLLKASRGLVGQLVRSNKSDTWYLYSAFYLLCGTIAWLVYRRLIYGPMMLLLVWPLKMVWFTLSSMGGALLGGSSATSSVAVSSSVAGLNSRGIPTHPPGAKSVYVEVPPKGAGWGRSQPEPQADDDDSMVGKVGKMAEEAKRGTNVDDITDEERRAQEAQPRNPKKRMMEVVIDGDDGPDKSKDEL